MSRPKKIRHLVIPDTQVKPGNSIEHLRWAGLYAAEHKPDVIVMIGDWWDMPSLSSYDTGTKSFEGRRYSLDIKAGIEAMEAFLEPINAEIAKVVRWKAKTWKPRLVFTLGNHENRINRTIESDPKLDGLIGMDDLKLAEMGWEVIPFLQPEIIDGIAYCHYFTSGVMGRPVNSAASLATKKMMSCVMGHVQDRDIAYRRRADGKSVTGLFAGIYYAHDEDYLSPQTNQSWRGIWMLNDVKDGAFDEMPLSLSWLDTKYGKKAA